MPDSSSELFQFGWRFLRDYPRPTIEIASHDITCPDKLPDSLVITPSPEWRIVLDGATNAAVLSAIEPGAELFGRFEGDLFAFSAIRHDYSGIVLLQIDRLHPIRIDLFDRFRESSLTQMFMVSGLGEGAHIFSLRLVEQNVESLGIQAWIRSFAIATPIGLSETGGNTRLDAARERLAKMRKAKNLIVLHAKDPANIGDIASVPTQYFAGFKEVPTYDLLGWHPIREGSAAARDKLNREITRKSIILGGGGLFENDFFAQALSYVQRARTRNLIIWGAGSNSIEQISWGHFKPNLSISSADFLLVGVRDYGGPLPWVPCASCMAPEFDENYTEQRMVGVFMHRMKRELGRIVASAVPDAGFMTNDVPMDQAIRFLGESSVVVTNSFHGAYWATLLGRKVVAIPSSSKFYTFKHPVPLVDAGDWRRGLLLARTYPEALAECRERNIRFASQVADALERL